MLSPRQAHIANALVSARPQTLPRALHYAGTTQTSVIQPPGVNRTVYISMGEFKPMKGYTYYNRILAVCYNVMQSIPRSECTSWVELVRGYMRHHYP
eukprot:12428291-Karenia_brevis.AAC.1